VEAATRHDVHTQEFCLVNFPDAMRTVSGAAFSNCHQLVKITIPDSVTLIGRGAFAGCTSLESICIPDSIWNGDGFQ